MSCTSPAALMDIFPGDDLSFLDKMMIKGEDYGYSEFMKTIDTVILGRRTYDWVMAKVEKFPHTAETFVITSNPQDKIKNVTFFTGNLKNLILGLKEKPGKNIFCDGGAELITHLLKDKLIDEMIISVVPVVLGEGLRLFKEGIPEQDLLLLSSRQYSSGLVQLHYKFNCN